MYDSNTNHNNNDNNDNNNNPLSRLIPPINKSNKTPFSGRKKNIHTIIVDMYGFYFHVKFTFRYAWAYANMCVYSTC